MSNSAIEKNNMLFFSKVILIIHHDKCYASQKLFSHKCVRPVY